MILFPKEICEVCKMSKRIQETLYIHKVWTIRRNPSFLGNWIRMFQYLDLENIPIIYLNRDESINDAAKGMKYIYHCT